MRKEFPIAYSTPMVGAVVAGRKTMTRRIVNTAMHGWDAQNKEYIRLETYTIEQTKRDSLACIQAYFKSDSSSALLGAKCPYGQSGDWLWVREEHQIWQKGEYWMCKYRDGFVLTKLASEISEKTTENLLKRKTLGEWQRARFLPKEFARIWLERTETKVERLQSITFKDAVAEGIEMVDKGDEGYKIYGLADNITSNTTYAPDSFKSLWESINGEGSWKVDPWVWVVGFKVVGVTGRPVEE